ncbi:MAG: 3-phosphoshikimate 1-carboxyvinyltransferase [Legionellaceae bacterium]|nr:3-phosphoshikimate 1-carboxyvinyltransferase [Legionellaceae bacterium]
MTSLVGEVFLPGDKSISHRALMFAAMTSSVTEIRHCLTAKDCVATARILQQLGVHIRFFEDKVVVQGVGLRGFKPPDAPLDCGNSGTTMRLLAGFLVGQPFNSVLIGDESLSARPMMRIVTPLRAMGARIEATDGHAPLKIYGQTKLHAIHYELPVASAQVKSCILLAGLYADGETKVLESVATRDHTERMRTLFLEDAHVRTVQVPGDLSSAAFFMVLASVTQGTHIILRDVGVNPTRTGIIDILKTMGADIRLLNMRFFGAEPVADIEVRYAPLQGVQVPGALLVRAIDEFPIVLIAAAMASGITRISGIDELRYKESDRVKAMADGLRTLNVHVTVDMDEVTVIGGTLSGGTVDACADHRIAMAFLMAGAVAKAPIRVLNTHTISTSFPTFVDTANQLGCLINA